MGIKRRNGDIFTCTGEILLGFQVDSNKKRKSFLLSYLLDR